MEGGGGRWREVDSTLTKCTRCCHYSLIPILSKNNGNEGLINGLVWKCILRRVLHFLTLLSPVEPSDEVFFNLSAWCSQLSTMNQNTTDCENSSRVS